VVSSGSKLSYTALAKAVAPAPAFLEGPEPELWWSVGEVLPDPVLAMIYAARGTGKSWAALDLALAFATMGCWLGRPEFQVVDVSPDIPRKVLYIDGELPEAELKCRLRQLCRGQAPPPTLTILSAVEIDHGPLNLADPEHQRHLKRLLKDYDVLIFDHWSALVLGQNVSSNDDLEAINPWLMQLRADGISVIYTHHENLSGRQLGAGGREFPLDAVLHLTKPTDYPAGRPARFKVKLEESRRMVEWTEPEVELQPDGRWTAPGAGGPTTASWTMVHWQMVAALAEGRSPATVTTGKPKARVLRALAALGWIEKQGEGKTARWRLTELGAAEHTKRTKQPENTKQTAGLRLVNDE
jgi:hypothetical protein